MTIFLVGFMGSGKTTVGRRLAGQIGYDFIDTDYFIEMQQKLTVAEIFARHGEADFRDMERNALMELRKCEFAVISTGGSMPCHDGNMDVMLATGKVVYLMTSPQTLARRLLLSRTDRPLIKGKTEPELQQYIAEHLAKRETFYNKANIVVQTEKYSIEEILQKLNLMKKT